MPITFEPYLVVAALLLILSVVASKISDRFGVPALLVFLAVGMLAGSDGPGGIYFDDPLLAQTLGAIALVVILFSGGLDTQWQVVRPVAREALLLATLGVVLTTLLLGGFAHLVFKISLLEGLLLGAIVSSTDAAAVFAVLRAQGVNLAGRLKPLLELESGSNDPMAVFLTIGLIQLALDPSRSPASLLPLFLQQMLVGVLVGAAGGALGLLLVNRLRLGYSGLYPVLALGMVFLVYGVTVLLGGSGFLAVYLAGLWLGRRDFVHKGSLLRFFDGMAWLMQIGMFLVLGLLVFPSQLLRVALPGLLIALFLVLVARPVAVLLLMSLTRWRLNEKLFISWVGLRGAVPIILATYPRIAGLEQSGLIFNVVFFVVLTSVLLQGSSLAWVARRLGLEAPPADETAYPITYVAGSEWHGVLSEAQVPPGGWAAGKAVYQLGLPRPYLIVLIARGKDFILPNGSIELQAGDRLLGLAGNHIHQQVLALLRDGPTALLPEGDPPAD